MFADIWEELVLSLRIQAWVPYPTTMKRHTQNTETKAINLCKLKGMFVWFLLRNVVNVVYIEHTHQYFFKQNELWIWSNNWVKPVVFLNLQVKQLSLWNTTDCLNQGNVLFLWEHPRTMNSRLHIGFLIQGELVGNQSAMGCGGLVMIALELS